MNSVSISPSRLLKDSFEAVKPIYGSILLLNSPSLIVTFINSFLRNPPLNGIIQFVYNIFIVPLLSGAVIIYTYQHLTRNTISVSQALQNSVNKYLQLLLGLILTALILIPAFILLIIPGIYLSVRLSFVLYAIAVEGRSATEGIRRSWELTKGRWWSVFWALLAVSLALFLPIIIVSFLLGAILGREGIALSQIISGLLAFLVTPIFSVYGVLLYMGLQRHNSQA
jgi:hypothetical protein